ncbi:MAG: transcriptional regulator [Candidatus Altiarchaeales archaeon HGW-Altiarchaeales-1]|nr:MAG: transcriptional regulator [Candidatus Altiarchaeales archaeon HGW-Altiarchaeales-1]
MGFWRAEQTLSGADIAWQKERERVCICHLADIADLKLPLIQSFLKEVESDLYGFANMDFEQLCWQMRIVDGTTEYLRPRNVGILFFNDLPQKFIPLSQIEIVQFISTPGGDKLSEKIFQGPIHQQIKDALTYVKNVILKEYIRKVPDKVKSIRFYNYPYIALKESIVNAIYHRSYEIREPVEIRIHPNKIEILSFPGPDRSIKQSDIDKGILVARRYRNRRIGEFLKELKLTEGRCTGIPKIKIAMKNNGSPEPVFETDNERSYFLTTLMIHPEATVSEQEGEQGGISHGLSHTEFSEFVSSLSQVCPKFVPSEDAAIILISARDGIDMKSLMSILNQTNRTRFRNIFIKPLIEADLLELTAPDKPTSSKQKYRATKKGLKIIDKVTNKHTLKK